MAQGKTILVLGGGIGGVVAASRLRQWLPREHRVVLIEREATFVFQPSLLWLMTGNRTRENISRPLARLEQIGIELVRGEIDAIDPAGRTVRADGRILSGDYLVLALGAELAPETVPGLVETGINLYTLAGAERLREARLAFDQGRLALLVAAAPFKCPAAPYETAMLLEHDCRRRGVRDRVAIDLYTPEPGPMLAAGPEVSKQVRQMVEAKNIGYHPEHAVTRVQTGEKRLVFANGASAEFDLLIYVPLHRAPRVAREAGLCGDSGWVRVDRATLATDFPGVYAVGDAAGIPLANGKPLPKAGVFAHVEAEVVARNIAAGILGKAADARFDGHGACFVEAGDGRAGFGSGDFYAEPAPRVALRRPSRWLHWAKVAYEKYWFYKWF